MEVIKKEKTIEEIIGYRASDGKFFSSQEECEKYEQSAQLAIYNGFVGLSVDGKPFAECVIWEEYGYGSDEFELLVIEIKNENDLKVANMFAEMQEPHEDSSYVNRFSPEHIGKRLLVSIGDQYQPCLRIWGTEDEIVAGFAENLSWFFHPEKKEGENNE